MSERHSLSARAHARLLNELAVDVRERSLVKQLEAARVPIDSVPAVRRFFAELQVRSSPRRATRTGTKGRPCNDLAKTTILIAVRKMHARMSETSDRKRLLQTLGVTTSQLSKAPGQFERELGKLRDTGGLTLEDFACAMIERAGFIVAAVIREHDQRKLRQPLPKVRYPKAVLAARTVG